jgi:hypothetical protein
MGHAIGIDDSVVQPGYLDIPLSVANAAGAIQEHCKLYIWHA